MFGPAGVARRRFARQGACSPRSSHERSTDRTRASLVGWSVVDIHDMSVLEKETGTAAAAVAATSGRTVSDSVASICMCPCQRGVYAPVQGVHKPPLECFLGFVVVGCYRSDQSVAVFSERHLRTRGNPFGQEAALSKEHVLCNLGCMCGTQGMKTHVTRRDHTLASWTPARLEQSHDTLTTPRCAVLRCNAVVHKCNTIIT